MLQVEGIWAGYGGVDVLKGVNLEVAKNEIVCIIGPNGAGKSTLLKTIIGLVKARKGRILFEKEDITDQSPEEAMRRRMGYVPQIENVFGELTVAENLMMGGLKKPKADNEIYSLFPSLRSNLNKAVRLLSGGERKMVALARALISQPKILMLDEPTAGLSPILINEVLKKIKEISNLGVTLLVVEQNARKILKLANRGYILVAGKNRLEGSGQFLLNSKEVVDLYLGR